MTENLNVLVVDDSDDLRDLLRMVLERNPGWHVVAQAAEGLQAVRAVITVPCDESSEREGAA